MHTIAEHPKSLISLIHNLVGPRHPHIYTHLLQIVSLRYISPPIRLHLGGEGHVLYNFSHYLCLRCNNGLLPLKFMLFNCLWYLFRIHMQLIPKVLGSSYFSILLLHKWNGLLCKRLRMSNLCVLYNLKHMYVDCKQNIKPRSMLMSCFIQHDESIPQECVRSNWHKNIAKKTIEGIWPAPKWCSPSFLFTNVFAINFNV